MELGEICLVGNVVEINGISIMSVNEKLRFYNSLV